MPKAIPIIIMPLLQQRFDKAWARCRVLFFSAPCGCGKTVTAQKLLSGLRVCRRSAERSDCLRTPIPDSAQVLLVDDLQCLKDRDEQATLCQLIRESPQRHFVLLSRGSVPGWLMPFQFAGLMESFFMDSLLFDREALKTLLAAHGITALEEAAVGTILRESIGHPAGLAVFCRRLATGAPLDSAMLDSIRHEIYHYFEEMVYHKLDAPLRRLIIALAPLDRFGVELAKMVSGDTGAGALLERLQQDTSMLLTDGADCFYFQPFLLAFLRWELSREYSEPACRALLSRAGLYYELNGALRPALDCYAQAHEHNKVSELLVKNAELHPGIAQYYELEQYYFSLPQEDVLRSPELMAGMSLLCALCMEYEQSEQWYDKLQHYATRLRRSDVEYRKVHGRIAYLDIALPQRGVAGLIERIPAVFRLITDKRIERASLSVTSSLPSTMNGGKDFCAWSKRDDFLYATLRKPIEAVLGPEGVGLADCGICESKFEKDEDYEARLLPLMARLSDIQRHGTPDMEFAVIGLLARIQLAQGKAQSAMESIRSLREKFAEKGESRFFPNMDAMLCRIHLHLGDSEQAEQWLRTGAPKEDFRLWPMFRYRYITRALVQVQLGDYHGALLVSRLLPYTARCGRVMDALHIHLILAICYHRQGDKAWETALETALDSAWDHRFVRPVAEYGLAILPLLTACGWERDKRYLNRVILATRAQAVNYPDYLQPAPGLSAPLTPTETQVMKLLCHNKSNREICEILNIALPTAKTHVRSILEKLGVSRRTEVRDAAHRLHLLP